MAEEKKEETYTLIGEVKFIQGPEEGSRIYSMKVRVDGERFGYFTEVSAADLETGATTETEIVGRMFVVMGHGLLNGQWSKLNV